MSILKKYNRNLLRRGFNGPLNFSQKFELGHIVTFDPRAGFEIIGHISNTFFNLQDFTPNKKIGVSEVDIDFGTETGVDIAFKLKGDAPIPNSRLRVEDAGIVIEFEKKASYLLKTEGAKVHYIENIAELGKKICALYKAKKWNRKWFVITNLIEAERSSLFIAKSSNSKVEIKAKASLSSISKQDLVNADAGLTVINNRKMQTSIIGEDGPYYPLFKLNAIKVRRLQPIGSEFEAVQMNQVNPMHTFTIDQLEKVDSNYQLSFEDYHLEDELIADEELV